MTVREFSDRLRELLDKHPQAGEYEMRSKEAPIEYEEKFPDFIRMCQEMGSGSVTFVAYPEVLGDNYAEIVESLGRLAEAGIMLAVAGRRDPNDPTL